MRNYEPGLGRYVEADPYGIFGGFNYYEYADSDPINLVDPYGLCVITGKWDELLTGSVDSTGICDISKKWCFNINNPWPWQTVSIYGWAKLSFEATIICEENCVCPPNPRVWVLRGSLTQKIDKIPVPIGNGCKRYKLIKKLYYACLLAKYSGSGSGVLQLKKKLEEIAEDRKDAIINALVWANDPTRWCNLRKSSGTFTLNSPVNIPVL